MVVEIRPLFISKLEIQLQGTALPEMTGNGRQMGTSFMYRCSWEAFPSHVGSARLVLSGLICPPFRSFWWKSLPPNRYKREEEGYSKLSGIR